MHTCIHPHVIHIEPDVSEVMCLCRVAGCPVASVIPESQITTTQMGHKLNVQLGVLTRTPHLRLRLNSTKTFFSFNTISNN